MSYEGVRDLVRSKKRQSTLAEAATRHGRRSTLSEARMSNLYWIKRGEFTDDVKRKCMVEPSNFGLMPGAEPLEPYCLAVAYGGWVGMPPGIGLECYGKPSHMLVNHGKKLHDPDALALASSFVPRNYQVCAVKRVMQVIQSTESLPRCLLCADCGLGKTAMALMCASQHGCKTAIVVHRGELLRQWIDRIHEFMPRASVGVVQGKKHEIDCDIVLFMMQTLIKHHDGASIAFPDFGLAIFDESHHVPAKTFATSVSASRANDWANSTPTRQDGLIWLLKALLGPSVSHLKRDSTSAESQVTVKALNFCPQRGDALWNAAANAVPGKFFLMMRARLISGLTQHLERNNIIADELMRLVVREGRSVIVLTERREHAKGLQILLATKHGVDSCLLVGGHKKKKRKPKRCKPGVEPPIPVDGGETLVDKMKKAKISIGTFAFASEGLDDKTKDTLMFATPTTNKVWLQQCVGRIQRGFSPKPPLVVDVVDEPLQRITRRRMQWYTQQKFNVPEEWSGRSTTRRMSAAPSRTRGSIMSLTSFIK